MWDESKIKILKDNWGKKTASEIAEMIGNVTRNACIGKAFRMKLSNKLAPKKSENKEISQNLENSPQLRKRTRRSKFISTLIGKDFPPERKITLERLKDGDCRYPNGHPNQPYPEFNFCGRPSVKGLSYCLAHLPLIYQPRNKKEDTINKEDELPKFIEKKIRSA